MPVGFPGLIIVGYTSLHVPDNDVDGLCDEEVWGLTVLSAKHDTHS